MQRSVLLTCIFCFLLGATWGSQDAGPELLVSTTLGTLSGSHLTSRSGRTFAAFRGVPYAKPPVADLRFKDPEPAEEWVGVLDATREGPICNQFNFFINGFGGTEDCLKLNVYTHDSNADQLKPVMVWIHGGGFTFGSGNGETDFFGPEMLMDKDIVLVTFNYRLGPFGFFTTGDAEAPGNYGLMDQTLALKWVQQHIRSFGGDPDSVTLFGESAGGASVEFQVLSPHSKGLFHRAISLSGSATAPWALLDTNEKDAVKFAEYFNCSIQSSSEIVACLKTKDANDIVQAASIRTDIYKSFVRYGARIDVERESPFLPAHPHQLIKNKSFNHVPYITGLNQNEGAMVIIGFTAGGGQMKQIFEKDPVDFFLHNFGMEESENGREIAEKIFELFDREKPIDQQMKTMEQVMSAVSFFYSIDQAASRYAKFSEEPTYYYHYAYRGSMSLPKLFGVPSDIDLGVCHGDEIFLMFTNSLVKNFPPEDIEMSKLLIDLWTSFAIHGTPQTDLDFQWLPMEKDKRRILNIDANPTMIEKIPFHDRLPFWNQLLGTAEENEEEGKEDRHEDNNKKRHKEL